MSCGNTPLHEACKANNIEKVKYLIEHRSNIDAENDYGRTPLYNAVNYD